MKVGDNIELSFKSKFVGARAVKVIAITKDSVTVTGLEEHGNTFKTRTETFKKTKLKDKNEN